jgi:hypothetical protein
MPLHTFPIPSAFNTLDDSPPADGHPLSSWYGREVGRNDRFLDAKLRGCLLNTAWDLTAPYTLQRHYWVRLAVVPVAHTTPGVRTCTVRMRGTITAGYRVHFVVTTRADWRPWDPERRATWSSIVGTGAVRDWSIAGVPLVAGASECMQVLAYCDLRQNTDGDRMSLVTSHGPYHIDDNVAPVPGALGVTSGYAVRMEDSAPPNEPITRWRQIIEVWPPGPGGTRMHIYPGWDAYRDLPADALGSGIVQWRARPVAQLQLRALAIDEDEQS